MASAGPVRRVAQAVGGSIDSAASLPGFQRELLELLRSLDDEIRDLNRSLTVVARDIEVVRQSLGPAAHRELSDLNAAVIRVEARVAHIDEQIPDPDAPSALGKAKDALLGSEREPTDRKESQ